VDHMGKFAVPIDLINALHDLVAEDFTTLYGYLNVKGKRVADVGDSLVKLLCFLLGLAQNI